MGGGGGGTGWRRRDRVEEEGQGGGGGTGWRRRTDADSVKAFEWWERDKALLPCNKIDPLILKNGVPNT